MAVFDENYWTNRYDKGLTQWDTGNITPPLKAYFDTLENKELSILIPGGGNGHEVAYLHENGFKNVWLLDFSAVPLQNFQQKYPDFPKKHLLQKDFFQMEGMFDLLVEQTFFCALHPRQRKDYARKAASLLKSGGHLAGLLFDGVFNEDQPPFGGSKDEYLTYFEPYFTIRKMEPCYNSLKPRAGRELWIDLVA